MAIRFRTFGDEDLEMIMRWRTDPEVSAYMYTDFVPDLARQRAWFRSISADPTRLDWVIQVDGEDVGLVSIVRIDAVNRRAEWAYYLASPSVRGKGIGKAVELNVLRYVFEDLGLHKLCCEVMGSNPAVVKIHEKFGSVVEGTRRSHIRKGGAFHDIVEMGILAEDWRAGVRDRHEAPAAEIDPPAKEVVRVGSDL